MTSFFGSSQTPIHMGQIDAQHAEAEALLLPADWSSPDGWPSLRSLTLVGLPSAVVWAPYVALRDGWSQSFQSLEYLKIGYLSSSYLPPGKPL